MAAPQPLPRAAASLSTRWDNRDNFGLTHPLRIVSDEMSVLVQNVFFPNSYIPGPPQPSTYMLETQKLYNLLLIIEIL